MSSMTLFSFIVRTSILSVGATYRTTLFSSCSGGAVGARDNKIKLGSTVPGSSVSASPGASDFDTKTRELYTSLKTRLQEIERLEGVTALMSWDEAVMMSSNSATARNQQKAALAGVLFEKKSDPQLGAEIEKLLSMKSTQGAGSLGSWSTAFDEAVVRDAARDFDLQMKKSKSLAMRAAELEGRGYGVWTKARKENDWKLFEPVLQEIIELKKEEAAVMRPTLSLYDANIDAFERGMKSERIAEVFDELKEELYPLIQKILKSEARKNYHIPKALQGGEEWAVDKQKELCLELASALGFDFTRGRFDVSVHPFTGGPHPTDVRITTRYSTENWLEGVAGTIHEVGHGLYEQGRNAEYEDLPVSRALSMGVHESQSLFWERMILQSRDFWVWATPIVHKHFPHTKECTVDDFYRTVNQVNPGLIRVDADEVTYPIHIILRFELEKAIFDQKSNICVGDLPDIWASTLKKSLDVDVPTYSQGILQDVHWPMGAFGYFPSYTLGAIIAVQVYHAAEREIPDMKGKIQRGEFTEIRDFLRKRIHTVGSLYSSPDELLVHATGKPIDTKLFTQYIKNKYSALYKLE